ncbi:MAG TPA: lysophospholipid acyltransferase family protein [Candidatus Dormibacteraeota bacterium]|nr:lysophospholipid acyltransferase family protein [Candidatus Dormibacteraeota bacterium]
MSAAPSRASRRPQLLAASYNAGARILRAVPAGLRHAASTPGGAAWFWLSRAQRRAALENYGAVLDLPAQHPDVARVARRAFQNYGRMLMDFVLLGGLTKREVLERVVVDGQDNLDAALEHGRGVVLALPHMGSWDMAAAYGAASGYPMIAVAERFPRPLDQAIIDNRRRFGLDVIALGRSAVREVREALAANKVVALVCDLQQGPGVEVTFFGRRAVVPSGPAAFSLKSGAPMLLVHSYASGPGRYRVVAEPGPEWAGGETSQSAMQAIIKRFETYIRKRPDQWYAFRPMFKS